MQPQSESSLQLYSKQNDESILYTLILDAMRHLIFRVHDAVWRRNGTYSSK